MTHLSELEQCRAANKHHPMPIEWQYDYQDLIGGDYTPSIQAIKTKRVTKVWCSNCDTTKEI